MRQQFARQVSGEIAALQGEPDAWAGYLAEADATAVVDGTTYRASSSARCIGAGSCIAWVPSTEQRAER